MLIDIVLPGVDCLIGEDFNEGKHKAVAKEPLTVFAFGIGLVAAEEDGGVQKEL